MLRLPTILLLFFATLAFHNADAWGQAELTDERAAAIERKITALDRERNDKVTLRMVPSHEVLTGGETLMVAVDFRIFFGWHMYGSQPGKSYIPATIQWQLPEGFQVLETKWSKTETEPDTGKPFYNRRARAVAKIQAPATLPAGEVQLSAKVAWQVCKEGCRVGSLTMPVKMKTGPEARESIFAPLLQAGPDR